MAQTHNTQQNTVQITRREVLKTAIVAGLVAAIAHFGLDKLLSYVGYQQQKEGLKQYTATQTPYTSTSELEQETITITYRKPQVTKTVTETETVKETVTKTITKTETVKETVTKTAAETRTETSTTPSSTTTMVQYPRTLEEILFGNSDLEFVPLRILDAKIDGDNAYLLVENPYTKVEVEIEIPVKYVSRSHIEIGNINITDILSAVRKYNSNNKSNYSVYFILGRSNINNAIELNGKWKLPAPNIYYNIIVSDKDWKEVYDIVEALKKGKALALMPTLNDCPYSDCVWGGSNQLKNKYNYDSIIIVYQNGQQVNEAKNFIKLASYILGKPDDKNPTNYGILHVDTVATVEYKGKYENGAPIFAVKNYKGTIILFVPGNGNPYASD